MKRIILTLLYLHVIGIIVGQSFPLQGVVTATDGELLIGVNIKVKDSGRGTITDMDGNFQLVVEPGEHLLLTYIGFKELEYVVGEQRKVQIQLEPDQTSLDEVLVVGYGKAKRITMTGAVSAVTARELRTVPTSNIQNALYGKLPGFFTQQTSGQPGKDASDFFIRGKSSLNDAGNQPLIIVDDVEYSYDQLSQINVNEIESISILKDASTTSIYGIKGANGVLVVKTRRGMEGKPQINLRMESGVQTPVRTPRFLNSFETASLVNEAYANDGLQPLFSDEDLQAFQDGSDPYGHPDVDWYNEIFKKIAFQENMNVDISGGTPRLKYFVSTGYFSQNGLVKDFSSANDDINTNYFYRRFNYRTNLDFNITEDINMRLDITSRFMNINEPNNMNATGEIYNFSKMRPYSAPFLNPNGSYAYLYDTDSHNPTLNARLANEGYRRTRRNDNNILYGTTWKMDFITEGLSSNVRLAYANIYENNRSVYRFSDGYPTYHYNPETEIYTINPNGTYAYGTYGIGGGTNQSVKDLNIQASMNYARNFKEVHDVNAMLLYNRQSRTVEHTGQKIPENFEGYTSTIGYKYKNKYLIDFNVAYNGSDRFGTENRFGWFPAVGVGYSISEEPFFKNRFNFVQLFKLRASYGLVGSDAAPGGRYLYNQVYEVGDNYYFGDRAQTFPGYREGDLGNAHVTWEKARKFDIGLDVNIFDNVSFTIDYFYDERYDQLVRRNDTPLLLGIGTAPLNVARTNNRGVDGQLGYQTRLGKVNFNTNLVFSYAKNKVIYKAEAQQKYDWLAETGKPIGQPFGYINIGYYSPDDILKIEEGAEDAPAVPNTDIPVQAGDLKYMDLNNDGVINDYDKGAIGMPNLPNTTLGWNIGGNWKGFSVSLLFQGSFNYSFSVVGTGIEPFKSQFQPLHMKRWTPERFENGEEIEFPRLTSNPATINSAENYMSDFWLIDAWYVRLKTVDISYQFPKQLLPGFLDSGRLYVNAYNLLTMTNYNKYQQDPEISTNSAGDTYMNQRVFNVGFQVSF